MDDSSESDKDGVERRDPTSVVRGLMPFSSVLGIAVDHYEKGEVRMTMPWTPALCTADGVLHGGVLMALADTSGAACALLNLPREAAGTTTVESKTNFLRAVRGGDVRTVSRPVHVGRTIILVETDLFGENGQLAARVSQSQLVLSGGA